MANTTVTDVSKMLLANVTAGVDAGRQKVSEAPGFSEAMNNAKDEAAKAQPSKAEAGGRENNSEPAKAGRTVVESPKSKEIKSEEPSKKDPIANEEDMKELTEEVASQITAIVAKISEILGISEEDIKTAMENLGMTGVDLLDPVSIKDLCMELTGTPDSISLLTNGELYEDVKEIAQTAEDAGTKITADFGMTKEEITEVINDDTFKEAVETAVADLTNKSERSEADDLPKEVPLPENVKIDDQLPIQDKEVEDEAVAVKAVADNTETPAATGTEATVVTVEVNRETEVKTEPVKEPVVKEEGETKVAQPAETTQTVNTTETFKPTVKTSNTEQRGNEENPENSSRFAQPEAAGINTVVQTETVNPVNNLGEVVETVRTYADARADQIMDQVTESIRVNYTADTTSMEMQLHPASLGTVNMQIASTGGVVTAHILVENEAVKTVLESQLITLQQTFEEQGQKVEAVEVSVANYDLNKGGNSDTGSDTQDRGDTRTGRVTARRRINLNDLDEEDIEELSEEEKITADMMARSGNSVDYTA